MTLIILPQRLVLDQPVSECTLIRRYSTLTASRFPAKLSLRNAINKESDLPEAPAVRV